MQKPKLFVYLKKVIEDIIQLIDGNLLEGDKTYDATTYDIIFLQIISKICTGRSYFLLSSYLILLNIIPKATIARLTRS